MDFVNWVTVCRMDWYKETRSRSAGWIGKKHVLLNVKSGAAKELANCAICDGRHNISRCSEFIELSINDRWKAVLSRTLYIGCLRAGHLLPGCHKLLLLHAKKDGDAPHPDNRRSGKVGR